ncbi:hypothetical protein ACOME3_008881 [Neoechinorhynchus agilis]
MGYDVNRFEGPIDEELICPICSGVLENPTQVPACEHAFCRDCICQWLSTDTRCPLDRKIVSVSCLKPVPRILRNLLNKLEIHCDNVDHGCDQVMRLELLSDHLEICQYNPKRPIRCDTCGLVVPQDEMEEHSCVRELRRLYDESLERICNLENTVQAMRAEFSPFTRPTASISSEFGTPHPRIQMVAGINAIPTPPTVPPPPTPRHFPPMIMPLGRSGSHIENDVVSNPQNISNNISRQVGSNEVAVAPIHTSMPPPTPSSPSNNNTQSTNQIGITDELIRWINSLQVARVTRWGGMISTPDMVLQGIIRRALVESGCPLRILNQLMINAHERSWPVGLQNLETRQINRMYYESYIPRRIPGRQAVVVMAADNRHMDAEMICEPGIVMIFAHGVQ